MLANVRREDNEVRLKYRLMLERTGRRGVLSVRQLRPPVQFKLFESGKHSPVIVAWAQQGRHIDYGVLKAGQPRMAIPAQLTCMPGNDWTDTAARPRAQRRMYRGCRLLNMQCDD
ncbi:hypothetical protein NDU88_004895 [Pleurodeles waltl]|uniref:Uncharacterized protein n=1 Tax=Pleurodeles waltl TaxID=8319 RepID=A0AAV7MHW5_PLEWA|nr:hypothetical protein NDU88_004895 [Pleurodeles waltl]